ncbi:hypothetical protein OG21DRAFT_1552878 [Imleria badia]|nr:hypothetical protein OG21DRAFT_1552878 [Imleria badia]
MPMGMGFWWVWVWVCPQIPQGIPMQLPTRRGVPTPGVKTAAITRGAGALGHVEGGRGGKEARWRRLCAFRVGGDFFCRMRNRADRVRHRRSRARQTGEREGGGNSKTPVGSEREEARELAKVKHEAASMPANRQAPRRPEVRPDVAAGGKHSRRVLGHA